MTTTGVLVVKTLAACSGAAMICSPALLIRQIIKKEDVGVASIVPLVSLLVNCHVWMLYGYVIENWIPIFWIYLFGDFAALSYVAAYWRYTSQKSNASRILLVTVGIMLLVSLYVLLGRLGYTNQSRANMGSVMGFLADASAVCLYASPLEKLLQVLKYKSAVFINIHMIIAGITNNVLWLTYGILTVNWFIISPSIFFTTMNSFTLVLCII
eukprot:jgi/Phyca11/60217/gw1.62.208.1